MDDKERIKQLEEALLWYVDTDEVNEADEDNLYFIQGKYTAMQLLNLDIEYPEWWDHTG